MQIVEVTWLDACSEDSYLDIHAIKNMKPLTRKNVGYKLDMSDQFITITKGIVENLFRCEEGFDGAFTIPKGMIIEVKEIGG